ncbi:hypothetical protein ACE3NQ_00400 [Paenibacillus terreus]|uniref:Uncharacterized protein n=1 Tax=Paenibacillus terreus TaxID=1387834 RepID=A0ABV5B0Z3_9BACL
MNRSSRDGPGSRELRVGATQTKEPRISPGSGTVETVRQVKAAAAEVHGYGRPP